MPHNKDAVQQWAAQVIRSPYWEDVKEHVRREFTEKLIEAAHKHDDDEIKAYAFSLRVLDEVIKALGVKSTEFYPKRHFFESAHESEELEDAK